jgi:hypothetical protein
VPRWNWAKKLTLNLKKCEVSSADIPEVNWRPVVEVKGTIIKFNPTPPFLGVLYNRTLSMKPHADWKAAILSKGSRVLAALSGCDCRWSGDLLWKVYQTSFLSRATYAWGGWLPWLSTSAVDTLGWAQNCNLRVITEQLASKPNKAIKLEAGVQSFGCLRDCTAAVALERSLRIDLAAHPRAAQVTSGVTQQFKRGTDGRGMVMEVISRIPSSCSHICPLGVGKGVLDCQSVSDQNPLRTLTSGPTR